MSGETAPAAEPRRACPICGKPATRQDEPFCSKRCAEVDLHRWMAGVYAVPASAADEEENVPPAEPIDP